MKIRLETTKCKRCGKALTTTNKSLYGVDRVKEEYGSICSECMTEKEKYEMLNEQAKAILR